MTETPPPLIVTVQGKGCDCETPSLQPGEQMTTRLTDYVRQLIANGCIETVDHPPAVQQIIAAGNAIDATDHL